MTLTQKKSQFNSIVSDVKEAMNGNDPTKFQMGIFKWIFEGTFNDNAVVEAVAGSGKTTTLEHSLKFIPKTSSVILMAFNKDIATELTNRNLPSNASASTTHSYALSQIRCLGRMFINKYKIDNMYKNLHNFAAMKPNEQKEFYKKLFPMKRIISLMKNVGFSTKTRKVLRPLPTHLEFIEFAEKYNVEIFAEPSFYLDAISIYNESMENTKVIDFDDMLLFAVAYNVKLRPYDFVFIDESQDLNPIQIELIRRMASNGKSRVLFVGDPHQSIYGFRGADPEAIESIYGLFNAVTLPLSTSFRCPKAVVRAVNRYVEQMEASPNAIEGVVSRVKKDEWLTRVSSGDFVLCRVTAPLAGYCLKMIREGKKACVKGKDIGEDLISTLSRITKSNIEGNSLIERITKFGEIESAKLLAPQAARRLALEDRVDTLRVLAEGINTDDELVNRIRDIFTDRVTGIVFSTVHSIKGLESDCVWIIQPEKMPHPLAELDWQIKQEENLLVVAMTRSKNQLYFVEGA